ncbi:hypothetical protein GF324_02975 [bacterium]|nr:hypothetical protein [bacterium]
MWGRSDSRSASVYLSEIDDTLLDRQDKQARFGSVFADTGQSGPLGGTLSWRRADGSAEAKPWRGDSGTRVALEDMPALRVGELVEHTRFGRGIVLSVEPYKTHDRRVKVSFEGEEMPVTMVQSKANLVPVRDFQ